MNTPGSTGKCAQCGAMVRWATLAASGEAVAIEPTSESRLLSHATAEPYRNVQYVHALVPHAERCGGKRRAA
jgi:hypothetical protein